MYTKLLALIIAATALSGCCVSGTGCATPTAGAPIAWDGLGEAPTADGEQGSESRPKRRTARNREIILGPLNESPTASATGSRAEERWTRQPNEDPEADARLARQLKICRNC
jgi:hypothetical protein